MVRAGYEPLYSLLTGADLTTTPCPFSQAFKAHRDAIDRGDTRSIKATRQALTKAQHERLRAGA